jgi:DHA3 family multidrug efflux protein-like MFS transporter
LGISSTGFIVGGMIVAKKGLGKNPMRTLLVFGLLGSVVGMLFTIRELWWLYVVGIFIYMCLTPVIEAAEQTVIQRVVPFERQGRVFGFAQSVEAASAPITAFLIGPIAEFVLIPYMNSDRGAERFHVLLGQGDARGIALVFLISGFIGVVITLLAFMTKSYRQLSTYYAKA